MSTTYEIPLQPNAEVFDITLGAVDYVISTQWNSIGSYWVISLSLIDGTPVLSGVPLRPGVDLLAQYPYLNITGSLYAQVDNDTDTIPSYDGLGTTGHLYYVTP